ncbi:hypothetical protein PR048_006510 [Dryococelus australis]|uniref:Uncharacterized protein n=1 Tax=Dryococelus australis TaxID=614101 RepID=A0ABQ9IB60_9NEOP|nr:hypothetical protein PR048_006510 [Dryococelus australis]
MRVIEASMEQRRNEGAGETGNPRENPPTNDSSMRKSGVTRPGIEPGSPWREASRLTAQPPWPHERTALHSCNTWQRPGKGHWADNCHSDFGRGHSSKRADRSLDTNHVLSCVHTTDTLVHHPQLMFLAAPDFARCAEETDYQKVHSITRRHRFLQNGNGEMLTPVKVAINHPSNQAM